MVGGWDIPVAVVSRQNTEPAVPQDNPAAPTAPTIGVTRPVFTKWVTCTWRCQHCGHTWIDMEMPMPRFCPLAVTDDDHAWSYPTNYP